MAKVTSKYQVTVPKAIAELYTIRPGDDIEWVAAGDVIRVIPGARQVASGDRESRLRLNRGSDRQKAREAAKRPKSF